MFRTVPDEFDQAFSETWYGAELPAQWIEPLVRLREVVWDVIVEVLQRAHHGQYPDLLERAFDRLGVVAPDTLRPNGLHFFETCRVREVGYEIGKPTPRTIRLGLLRRLG